MITSRGEPRDGAAAAARAKERFPEAARQVAELAIALASWRWCLHLLTRCQTLINHQPKPIWNILLNSPAP